MGLFDNYYDPSSYQGGGGLIDRLMSTLGVQSGYQPSQGFPASPMNANASVVPQQNYTQAAPIAVGDYQMPRMGGAQDYAPQAAVNSIPNGNLIQPQQPMPQMAQQPMQQPAAPSNGGFGGAFQGAMANAQGGPLGLLFGGIAGAMGMGRGTVEQQAQALKQQEAARNYRAYVQAGVPQAQALIAALNPEAGKKILENTLGPNNYGFTTLPDGTIVRQDPRTGQVAPVYQGGTKPTFGVIGEQEGGGKQYGWIDAGKRSVVPLEGGGATEPKTIAGPDGKPIPVPAGNDGRTFVKEVTKANADAAVGKMTETQAKASSFAARMEQAESTLGKLQNEGTGYWGKVTDNLPLIGGTAATNWTQSSDYQKYKNAASAFITAMLRQESGAAINKDEFSRYEKEYFPQPGDGKEVIAQKAALRATALEQMKRAAGPGFKSSGASAAAPADPLGIR